MELIVLEMSCDDLESMCSGVSLLLQPSGRLHELSLLSKSFSSIDARHALKLCEMSCVVMRVRVEVFFFGSVVQSLSQCHSQSDATPEVTVETLVSLLHDGRALRGGRRPCDDPSGALIRVRLEGWNSLFACLVRLIDKTA